MSKIRTFIAVSVSERIRASASRLIERLSAAGVEYRWLSMENLHITMSFLGDIPDIEVPELCRDIKKVAQQHEPFSVEVAGLGGFPDLTQPRTIWVGVNEGTSELVELNTSLAEVLRDWGIPKEKNKYLPHMTLGRLGRGARWNPQLLSLIDNHAKHVCGACVVNEVIVYSSFLDRIGPTYTPMSRIKLLGDD